MSAEIRQHNGVPTLFIDGQPMFAGYMWGAPPAPDEFRNADIARGYAAAGIHLYAFDVGSSGTPPEWCGPHPSSLPAGTVRDHFDFSTVETRFQQVIKVDPLARFHLRVHLEMPSWWHSLYPDECELVSNGERRNQSFASIVWRDQACAFLRAYIAHVKQIGMDERVIAYQTGAGTTGEWVKETAMSRPCGDYSKPMHAHFRQWLRARYADEQALRSAWRDQRVTFDNAEVPLADAQLHTRHFTFRDPHQEQQVIDYYRCLSDLCADLVIDFNRTVKEATQGRALAGAFFGYLSELAWNSSFFGSGTESETAATQQSGHLGLQRVLHSPYVDFIVSPYSYGFRGIGGEGAPMLPLESVRQHGKLYIYEEDSRVHTAQDDEYGHVYTNADSISVLRRNLAQVLTHGSGIWWLGEHINTHADASFVPVLRQFAELGDFAMKLDRTPSADIAVVLDDESFLYQETQNDLILPLIFQQRLWGLPRMGAPFDFYLLDDLLNREAPPYRLYIMLNAFALRESRRNALKQIVQRDGRTVLWLYAAGYLNPDRQPPISLDYMEDLTGIHFAQGSHPWGPMMHIVDFQHKITRELPQDIQWGTNSRLGPVFHVADSDAHELGQVVHAMGRCKPGFVVKTLPAADGNRYWTSVYCAAPNLPAPVLRGIARFAGAHIYSADGDVLYATRDLLAVHTVAGGWRVFDLPSPVQVVVDLFENRVVARNTKEFEVNLAQRSTQLYYMGEESQVAAILAKPIAQ